MAGRNCAKCCVFPWFRGFEGSQRYVRKARWCEGSAAQDVEKIAPRLRARAIWKSKSFKTDGLGTFLEVLSAFRLAGAGISKPHVGRRGGFEEAPKRCVSAGRGEDFVLCDVDV